MSSAETPVLRPPRIIAGVVEIGERIPIVLATCRIFPVPTCIPTWANTLLSEMAVASASVSGPL